MTDLIEELDPIVVAWIVGAAAIAAGCVWLYRKYRRRAERSSLQRALGAVAYEMLVDVLIPDGMDGQLHVDYLLLTQRGILVVDLREVPGMIFGGDQMDEWAVMTRSRRYSFQNPQSALLDRVAAVKQLAVDAPVEGRVLFTDRSRFPKGRPKSVLMLDSLKVEYAPVDKGAMQPVVEKFRPGWDKLRASAKRSNLARS